MKERLDVLLVKRNLAESREKAKAIIMSGNVLWKDKERIKQGQHFRMKCRLRLKGIRFRMSAVEA